MVTLKNQASISEAANKIGVSIDTIRRWHKKGLIKAHRDARNNRSFDLKELSRVQAKYTETAEIKPFKQLKNCKKNGFRSIELFAGAGGLALGLENAGFSHELLVEFDKDAAETLHLNRPHWKILCQDVRQGSFRNLLGHSKMGV